MKKSLFLIGTILIFIFLFSGCGQNIQVTVWNNSGIVPYYSGEWIDATISSNTGVTRSQEFLETAVNTTGSTDVPLDNNNSFTVTLKENANITVTDNGYYYANGVSTTTAIQFSNTASQTIYGGFPDSPHWYAACFLNSVIIYKQ